ncbi:MAG TPA: hypothetical protein VFA56_12795 [Gaiellaceae bacterium]|nr:hypothetical protein [Gaiellaceae bacterium]
MQAVVWIGKWSIALAAVGVFVHKTWPFGLLAIPLVVIGLYANLHATEPPPGERKPTLGRFRKKLRTGS